MTILKHFGSLRFTLVSIVLAMILIFKGTLAQVHIGTFAAQETYFNSFFIYGSFFGHRVPIFPGGLSVGAFWLVNLAAAFVFQFRFVKKKTGLLISHFGLILLLLGQFLTQTLAKESQMPVEVGKSRNYSEAPREMELVFIDSSHADFDTVTRIPQSRLRDGALLQTKALPFKIRVKKYFENSQLTMSQGEPTLATHGVGTQIRVEERAPISSDDEANAVSAIIEIESAQKNEGCWLASSALGTPQTISVSGRDYSIAVRPRRTYYPFTLHLKEFKHDIYPGTEIPKNFSSLIHLIDPQKNENRDALIYMNHPLRYDGKTFYQASFANNDTVSIFQVVENPAWLTPYVSCVLVALGLLIQFLMSLSSFLKRRA